MINELLFVGIACMAFGMVLIPVGDAIGRVIVRGSEHSPMFVASLRFMIGAAIVLPLALWMKLVRLELVGAMTSLAFLVLFADLAGGVKI